MDQQNAVTQNEQLLKAFLDKADKKFVNQVGVIALTLLTEHMPPEQYEQFLSECADNAVEMHRYKMVGAHQELKVEQASTLPENGN
jgi:hypothetical protein